MTAALTAPPATGVLEALVAVTGVRDDVGDVIVPGAFATTLKTRKPKVCLGHDWNRPIGRVLDIRELKPGHPDLPKTTAEGKPWPREAGAVWARYLANLATDDGRAAFETAKFFGAESSFSIGYKATTSKHRNGTRYIHELDLFEFGPVLHPANRLATLMSVKGAHVRLETKASPLLRGGRLVGRVARSPQLTTLGRLAVLSAEDLREHVSPERVWDEALVQAEAVQSCAICGGKAGSAAEALERGHSVICRKCLVGAAA